MQESETTNEPTTSDRVYSRALERTILNPNPSEYRTTLSIPDSGGNRRISFRQRLSSSGNTSDLQVENGQSLQKMTRLNPESNNRAKKLSFLSARRRASYFPTATSNASSDDPKKKRDLIWPLPRSYSFDTPFHREAIDALNKGRFTLSISKTTKF